MSEHETPTFPVETRIETAETYGQAAKFYLGWATKARERGDYAEEQRYLTVAADNFASAAEQVRGALAQSKTDEDYASRKV